MSKKDVANSAPEAVVLTKEQEFELNEIVKSLTSLDELRGVKGKWMIGQELSKARSFFGDDADKPYGLWIKDNLSHITEIFDPSKEEDANRKNRNRILTIGKLKSWKMIDNKLGLGLSVCYKLKHDDIVTLNGLWNEDKEEFTDLEAVAEVATKFAPKAKSETVKADTKADLLDKANKDLEDLEKKYSTLERKSKKQETKINKLEADNKAKDDEISKLKAQLEALQNQPVQASEEIQEPSNADVQVTAEAANETVEASLEDALKVFSFVALPSMASLTKALDAKTKKEKDQTKIEELNQAFFVIKAAIDTEAALKDKPKKAA